MRLCDIDSGTPDFRAPGGPAAVSGRRVNVDNTIPIHQPGKAIPITSMASPSRLLARNGNVGAPSTLNFSGNPTANSTIPTVCAEAL